MKHIQRNLKSIMHRKDAKNYRHNMNTITFLKSNYKYKRRSTLYHIFSKQQRQWHLPHRLQKRKQKHNLPANKKNTTEDKQLAKIIPCYKNIRLDKFLRIFILIMQQATSPNDNSNNNNSDYFCFSVSKSDSSRLVTRLVTKIKAINNANKKSLAKANEENKNDDKDGIRDANKDTNISNIADEMSHQQHNYEKVSTITSTPIKCQRRKHHQIKDTNSSSSLSSHSPTFSLKTRTATFTMATILSTPSVANYETCQWTVILRHYVCDNPSIHQHQQSTHTQHHTPHINSLATSRVFNTHTSNNNNSCSCRSTTPSCTSAGTSIYPSVDQYVNAAWWNRSYTLSSLLLMLFIVFTIGICSTTAGACWQTVLDNGKCNEIFSFNISKSECCGANQEFAYTEREPTNVEYFFATAIGGGMECSPCLESCMNVKCGPNKKCVKRKGRPKCICAPECGAAKRKRKQREQQPQTQPNALHLVSSHVEYNNEDGVYFQDVPSAIRLSNAFKIKIEKSQQSRDTRSLSSEITNVNLGLENGKDPMISSSDVTASVEQYHCKELNKNQRKLKHISMHHSHEHVQQQQQPQKYIHQPTHKNQEPEGNRRLLITTNVEHTEKPTTRRLQIFSNVRTTQARRQNSNNNKSIYGQYEGTDPSDYDEENDKDYNYNDAEDDNKEANKKSIKTDIGSSYKNNRNDDSNKSLNQSQSRHKLKANVKPNNNNNKNKNRNKKHHDLQTTKIRQNSGNNNFTRVIHHAENNPHHRHHNHHNHNHHRHQHQQQQQKQQHERNQNTHQQQSQTQGRHKHRNNSNKHHHKQQPIVLKKPKNNKNYNITTNTRNHASIAVLNTTTTTTAKENNVSDRGTDLPTIVASSSAFLQARIVKIATTPTSLNISLQSPAIKTTTTATINVDPRDTQSQMFLSSSSSATSSFSSATPLNSTMSADDGAAADDHYHSRLPNQGSKIATSSLLSATSSSSSSLPSASPSPSPSSSSYSQMSAVPAHSSSESPVATKMSAIGEGVSLHDHHNHRTEMATKTTYNNKNNNGDITSAFQSNLHNNQLHQQEQQQEQQQQTQPQSQHHYETQLFQGISEQFDLIGFPNSKKQQRVTNGDNVRSPNPVCGTDGRTYNTECQLRKRACRTDNSHLQISYLGHCRTTCNRVKCLNGLTCVEDQYSMPHCIACKIECPQDDYDVVDPTRTVCGADGKTYKSSCDINRMICEIGRSVGVAYPGPCREDQVTCDDINCGPKQVCLIDLLTHKPRCTSCRYKCSRKRRPSSPHFDEGKLCGFNNRTYNSWCEMRKDSCSTGFYIDVKYSGDCH